MQIINTGGKYTIYNNSSLKSYDQLPAQLYNIVFHPQQGFWLEAADPIVINEKTYGVHQEKVDKVINSFNHFTRNLGVILSGDKGIGKSLFAKMLSINCIDNGIPVIIANEYIPGIADFLASIQQEVAVLFDEFDKTFNCGKRDEMSDPQTEMLTLFDGLFSGKKLFIVTCNELKNLNSYLVNRPGRFHYHFRFEYPDAAMIREYLSDKLTPETYQSESEKVVSFASRVPLNYDCLRAIAFELSLGGEFEEIIKDLNIVNIAKEVYRVTAHFTNGATFHRNICLDLFGIGEECFWFENKEGNSVFRVNFDTAETVWDSISMQTICPGDRVTLVWAGIYEDDDDDESDKAYNRTLKEMRDTYKLSHLSFTRKVSSSIHYTVQRQWVRRDTDPA